MKKILFAALTVTVMASCSNSEEQAKVRQQATIDSLQTVMMKQRIADSVTQAVQLQQAQTVDPNGVEMAGKNTSTTVHHVHHSSGGGNSGSSASGGSGSNNNTSTAAAEPTKKKGWNAKTKGAIIGAGAGAVTGAMVDGRKGEGAVVGGLIGAASGLGVGAIIDKKQKDKEEKAKAANTK